MSQKQEPVCRANRLISAMLKCQMVLYPRRKCIRRNPQLITWCCKRKYN